MDQPFSLYIRNRDGSTTAIHGVTEEQAETITCTTDIAGTVEEYGRCDCVTPDGRDVVVVACWAADPGPFDEEA